MRLSIIIPAYNPNIADIFGLLSSVRTQLAVDWAEIEVIIANDAGEPLPDGLFGLFAPLRIRQISLPVNAGPGIARQTGIDAATGDYLMFADADDVLHNVGVISAILGEIATGEPDILITKWIEEVRTDAGPMVYTTHNMDWTWMHGKVIRAAFVRESGVRHHPDLRVHEDSYYLNCLSAHSPRVQESDTISYVWRWHDESITRRDSAAYSYDSMPTFLRATALADAYIEGVRPELLPERVAYRISYIYHLTHSDAWTEEAHRDARATAEEALAGTLSPMMHYYADASEDVRRRLYADTMQYAGGAIPGESISEWMRRIGLGEDRDCKNE